MLALLQNAKVDRTLDPGVKQSEKCMATLERTSLSHHQASIALQAFDSDLPSSPKTLASHAIARPTSTDEDFRVLFEGGSIIICGIQ